MEGSFVAKGWSAKPFNEKMTPSFPETSEQVVEQQQQQQLMKGCAVKTMGQLQVDPEDRQVNVGSMVCGDSFEDD